MKIILILVVLLLCFSCTSQKSIATDYQHQSASLVPLDSLSTKPYAQKTLKRSPDPSAWWWLAEMSLSIIDSQINNEHRGEL